MTLVRLRRERVPVACGLLSACLVLVGGPVRAGVPDFDAPQLLGADIGKGEGALAADLNRDGLQDIAACGAKGVGWYLQAPVGVFTFHAGPTVGACHALRVADLDGDGAPDVVYIGDTGSGYVHVGADGASFTNTAVSAADSGASILAVGDLNNDGAIDITTQTTAGQLHHRLNDGKGGTWTDVQGVAVPPLWLLELWDLNGDGALDLAYIDSSQSLLGIVYTTGVGTGTTVTETPPYEIATLALADSRDNGQPKLTMESLQGLQQYAGNGSFNTWPSVVELPVAFGDVDGDGFPEVIGSYGGLQSWSMQVELGPVSETNLAPWHREGFGTISLPDIDGDGDLDMLSFDDSGVWLAINRTPHARLPFTNVTVLDGTYATSGFLAVADVNGDGMDDVIVGGLDQTGATVALNDGADDLPATWPTVTVTTRALLPVGGAIDVNLDGAPDVVVKSTAGGLYWYQNGSSGSSWTEHSIATLGASSGSAQLALCDFDRDGAPDVAAADSTIGTGSLSVFYNPYGAGAWKQAIIASSDTQYLAVDSGDVDRDGAPDLLVAAENAGVYSVSWFHNPSGRASPWPRYTIFQGTTAITSVHLADADGDGWLDAWVAAGGTVSVLSSEMTPEMPWTVIGSAAGAGNLMGPIMDLNRDGSPDLLVGDADSVQWLRFDRILGDFLPPVVVQGSLVNPAMFSTIRPGVFDVVGPAYAAEGGSTRVAWNSNESISSYVTSAPGPANGTRLTDTVGGAPIEFQLTHEGRPGDASLSPLQLDLAATLDGGTLDPADLIANYDPQIWADVDGDGQLNLTTDALIPSSASVVSGAARLTVDPTAVPWSVAPPMPGGSASGLYFVELTLTRAAVLAPLAPLQLNLNGGSVVVATAPHGAPARQTSVPGTSGTVQVGDTPPSAPNLQVAVMEGGDALFDPLSGVTDAAGETVTFVGIAGAPMLGTATIQGSQILYVNDGTEVPQDEMLVTLSDGIQDVPRLIIFNVQLYVHAPYATDSTVTTLEDHAATFDLEGGDLDNVPTFNVTIPPVHGQIVTTATSTGLSVEYTPALHYSGSDQLTFVVQGGALTSAPATVAITVTFDGNDDDDNDGIINRLDNCPFVYNPDQSDINHNGIGDVCDPDMDGDGILNGTDNCPRVYNPDQSDINHNGIGDACDPDMDGDGVPNGTDNCPTVYNPDQSDINHNGLGDACDPDMDGDGVLNAADNCPTVYNPDQSDINHNGIGDACDPDIDGDGVLNAADNYPYVYNPDQADFRHIGLGDACNPDIDGDGVPGVDDCNDKDPTVWKVNTFYDDEDADGFGDSGRPIKSCTADPPAGAVWDNTDNCPTVYNPDQADSLHNGVGDACRPHTAGASKDKSGCASGGGAGDPTSLLVSFLVLMTSSRRRRS